ncbi:MAG: hypothetical protein A2X49_05315 [Lentisphaerae bacterium GWF2_52_8]|nr:MAG: hypothetical protein A2X49_05315 [Lentisphaerae bacterium GWF2_52_8]
MKEEKGIQSLERGMALLKILSEKGPQTASTLARGLGIHQSSASRLLLSLQKAGFVRKPAYHSFALDYGVLSFAGIAMAHFPIIGASAKISALLHNETGCGAAVAILQDDRLLYLSRIASSSDGRPILVDDSSFPLHRSALGLLLAHGKGKKEFCRLMKNSAESLGEPVSELGLYRMVTDSLSKHGILFLRDWQGHKFNAVRLFEADGRQGALAIFSGQKDQPLGKLKACLEKGSLEIESMLRK